MSSGAMLIIAVMYAVSAYEQLRSGNVGLGLAFSGWSVGQLGMAWAVK